MTGDTTGTGYIEYGSPAWKGMSPPLLDEVAQHAQAPDFASFTPADRPLIKRQEFLALALVGASVACATFWSTVLLGPALVAWLGVAALAWLLPLLFPLALCGSVYTLYRLGRHFSGAKGVNPRHFPHFIFSRLTLIRATVSMSYAVALALALKLGSGGFVLGGLWIPCLMVLGVYLLGRVVHRLVYNPRKMPPNVYTRARAARYMLMLGACLNGLAYLSITMVPTTMPFLIWLMPVCLPLIAALGIGYFNLMALQRLRRQNHELIQPHHLAIQPYYSGIVIIATLLPYAIVSAKVAMPGLMALVGGGGGLVIGVFTPVLMCLVAVTLGFLTFRALQSWWDQKIDGLEAFSGDVVGEPEHPLNHRHRKHDHGHPFGTTVPELLAKLDGPATPDYPTHQFSNPIKPHPKSHLVDKEQHRARQQALAEAENYDADTEEGTTSENTDGSDSFDSSDGSDNEHGGSHSYNRGH